MSEARLRIVPHGPGAERTERGDGESVTATQFSETVRTVVSLARSGGLDAPVFRSPPTAAGVDRTIRRRGGRPPIVAIARAGRPVAAVQSDVIEALVVTNRLDEHRASRFRRAAWAALEPAIDLRRPRHAQVQAPDRVQLPAATSAESDGSAAARAAS